jgi:small subunit ribosomal protein S5
LPRRQTQFFQLDTADLKERVVHINRVAKVVKGGRRFSFSALVVIGDGAGHVGYGVGKAKEVPEAIRKAAERARKTMLAVPLLDGTVPYAVEGRYGAAAVVVRPAAPGTGVIAGGGVRAVVELAGIQNVLTKSLGSRNAHNVVKATMDALAQMATPEEIASTRGREVVELR